EKYLYSLHVTTNLQGIADFVTLIPPGNDLISATATDEHGNTSEFSMVDSDADRLADFWEENGIDVNGDGTIDVRLSGANPGHKDVFVEVDAMENQVLHALD